MFRVCFSAPLASPILDLLSFSENDASESIFLVRQISARLFPLFAASLLFEFEHFLPENTLRREQRYKLAHDIRKSSPSGLSESVRQLASVAGRERASIAQTLAHISSFAVFPLAACANAARRRGNTRNMCNRFGSYTFFALEPDQKISRRLRIALRDACSAEQEVY